MSFAAPAIIRASKYWTPRMMAKESEHSGRKSKQTAGSYLDDLVQTRRVICLSVPEARKFSFPKGRSLAEKYGYVIKKSIPIARSWCDATREFNPDCIVFFPKELA